MNVTTSIPLSYTDWTSPVGELRLVRAGPELRAIWFRDAKHCREPEPAWCRTSEGFEPVLEQLAEYFAGRRRTFDLRLRAEGTEFQREVWKQLVRIPAGETASYGELARRVGRPTAVRAVAAANARNPISIVIPCHRVIGSDGRLTGYAGGVDRKRRLLELEGAALADRGQTSS